jgi:hypothetical protein
MNLMNMRSSMKRLMMKLMRNKKRSQNYLMNCMMNMRRSWTGYSLMKSLNCSCYLNFYCKNN